MAERIEKAKGALLMVLACAMFCIMASLIKYVSHIDAYKTALARFVVGMAILGGAAISGKIRLTFNNRKLLVVRGFVGGVGVLMFFLVIVELGLGKGTVLFSTYPIFACILSAIFLKEKPGLVTAVAISAALCGIYLLTAGSDDGTVLFGSFGLYELLALCGGLCGGIVVVTIRKLHESDSSCAIFFSQCAIGFWLVVIPANIKSCTIGLEGGIILVLIGATAAVGQLLMTQSYKYLPVRIGSVLGMLEPVFCYIVGIVVFSELLLAKSALGSSLILCACVAVLLYNSTGKAAMDEG